MAEKRKSRKKEFAALLVVLFLGFAEASQAAPAEEWFLMSSPGECVNINSLRSMVPDIGESTGPQSFVELMKKRGHKVSAEEVSGLNGEAITVKVPEKGLNLTFAKGKACSSIH